MIQRGLVLVLLLPIGLVIVWQDSWWYAALAMLILSLAAWEYTSLFRSGGYRPARALVVGSAALLPLGRYLSGFESGPWMLSLMVLLSMVYHLIAYERGRDQAATDFSITVTGMLYLGWVGAYFISLRQLPDGKEWLLLVLSAVWSADTGAYLIGSRFGRHALSPRLSPKKTWEGYLAGIVTGILGTTLVGYLWSLEMGADPIITAQRGALMGLMMGVFPTLGDLGASMVKRQVGAKDSGKLLPGHGGMFDRIDSWLWAAVLGYYLITWLWL